MPARTVRAVEQQDGRFRIAVEPSRDDIDTERSYDHDEVVAIAERLRAELRWVGRPDTTRGVDSAPPLGAPADGGVTGSISDPWGGDLPSADG
jgi:hypothetical protein